MLAIQVSRDHPQLRISLHDEIPVLLAPTSAHELVVVGMHSDSQKALMLVSSPCS